MTNEYHFTFNPESTFTADVAGKIQFAARRNTITHPAFDRVFYYDHETDTWFVTDNDDELVISSDVSNDIDDLLDSLTLLANLEFVRIIKGAGVLDHTAAIQGYYGNDSENFPGCTAHVDNFVGSAGPQQVIKVQGPYALVGKYYTAIRSHAVKPYIYHEPENAYAGHYGRKSY